MAIIVTLGHVTIAARHIIAVQRERGANGNVPAALHVILNNGGPAVTIDIRYDNHVECDEAYATVTRAMAVVKTP